MFSMQNACFSFAHFNSRSVCAGFDLFNQLVISEDFSVIGLSETWLDDRIQNNTIHIEDYVLVRKDRETRGGGVAFYIKNSIKFQILDVSNNGSIEQLWISLKIGGKRLCLGTLYRPPNTNLMMALDSIENVLIDFLPEFDYVLFGGDLNVDLLNKNNAASLLLTNFFNKYGLFQIVDKPTRITDNTQTLIDLIVSTSSDIIANCEVINADGISDHRLVACNLKFEKNKQSVLYRTFRDFSNFNYDFFVQDLNLINFDLIYNLESVDEVVHFWNENITWLFNIHAPYKTVRITKPPAPWLTENLKIMMKLRDKAYSKYKKTKTDAAWTAYKDLRNFVNMAVKSEKKAFLHYKFKNDPKTFWRTLKSLHIHSNVTNPVVDIASPDDFNNFFINSVPQATINNNFITNNYVNKRFPGITEEFNFQEVSVDVVEKIFTTIKSNAKGSDDINLKMLSLLLPHLSSHLTFLINKCLISGSFPNSWKYACVSPVPKKTNPTRISDFRPISILPTISKMLEKIIYEQLSAFLNNNNILPPTQSGFRANHSTTTALLHVTDELFRARDSDKNTCLVLLDYSKAFDTLDSTILCLKLKYFGIGDLPLKFFADYLSDRQQKVYLNGNYSKTINVNKGVPQGSILGPLLFSVYTADFCSYLKFSDSHQYADDYQILHHFTLQDIEQAADNLNFDLDIISTVSNAHGLILNENKTEVLVYGKHRELIVNNPVFSITLNGKVLSFSEYCKDLGIFLDFNLRFQKHVSNIMQKSFSKLKVLYFHKDILSSDIKLKLCDSLILSYVAYGDLVYWPAILNKDKESLQRLQNACLRFSYNLRKFDHVTNKFVESKWLYLNERFVVHMACLVYKTNKLKTPKYLHDKLLKGCNRHERTTRHRDLYTVPRHSSAQFQRSFTYNAIKIYNKLPSSIKSSPSVTSFRKQVKSNLVANRNT